MVQQKHFLIIFFDHQLDFRFQLDVGVPGVEISMVENFEILKGKTFNNLSCVSKETWSVVASSNSFLSKITLSVDLIWRP